MRLTDVQREIRKVEDNLNALRALEHKAYGRKTVACTNSVLGRGCGKRSQIQSLTYIQTHFHVPPYSCTEGDYWTAGEGQFDCPKCGRRNRLYDRPKIMDLKNHFSSIERVYDD